MGSTSLNISSGIQPLVVDSEDAISRVAQSQKATKADDAAKPGYLWNDFMYQKCSHLSLYCFRCSAGVVSSIMA
jgi:hypothetical protein